MLIKRDIEQWNPSDDTSVEGAQSPNLPSPFRGVEIGRIPPFSRPTLLISFEGLFRVEMYLYVHFEYVKR